MPPDPLESGEFESLQDSDAGRGFMKNKGEKRSRGGLIFLVLILLLIGAIVAVIALNVGGIRENHIMRYLRNAPLIGSQFSSPEEDPIDELSPEELRRRYLAQRDQISSLQSQIASRDEQLANANAQIAHLSTFRDRWQMYRNASARFGQILAHNDPVNFVEFFEYIDEDLVPHLIADARAINVFNEELQAQVRTFNAMEESRAAEDLTHLLVRDTALAVRILREMGASRRAAIFDEMDYTTSLSFHVLLSTSPPTFTPLVPPPYLPEIPPMTPAPTPAPTPTPVTDVEGEYENDEGPETEYGAEE
jgi:hypothetical protein